MEGYEVKMPDGACMPQLVGKDVYKYLGTELPTGWANGKAQEITRMKVRSKCRSLLGMLASIPVLTDQQLGLAMSLAVAGVIGYYGRSTVITWEDCQRIEAMRADALRRKGRVPGKPRLQVYASHEQGGMGWHRHAYTYAAAAIIDQFDRNLCTPVGTPGRVAVESAVAATCMQLGLRGLHPLDWHPSHLEKHLREEMIVEAWLLAKLRTKLRSRVTEGGRSAPGPMKEMMEGADEMHKRGPELWTYGQGNMDVILKEL